MTLGVFEVTVEVWSADGNRKLADNTFEVIPLNYVRDRRRAFEQTAYFAVSLTVTAKGDETAWQYKRLGDLLTAAGVIQREELNRGLELQKGTKDRLGTVLIKNNINTEQELIEALQMQLGIEFIDLTKVSIPTEMAQALPKNIAIQYQIVPIKIVKDELYLANERSAELLRHRGGQARDAPPHSIRSWRPPRASSAPSRSSTATRAPRRRSRR